MRIIVATNTTLTEIPSNGSLRDIDREDLVKKLIMYGLEPVKVEGDEQKIIVYFLASDTERFENEYLSNKNLLVPLQRVTYANEYWRDMMTLWKSKLRQAANA